MADACRECKGPLVEIDNRRRRGRHCRPNISARLSLLSTRPGLKLPRPWIDAVGLLIGHAIEHSEAPTPRAIAGARTSSFDWRYIKTSTHVPCSAVLTGSTPRGIILSVAARGAGSLERNFCHA